MKIEGSLQIGIICGLIKIEGAGRFLNENTYSKKTSRVALYYEKQTKLERIPMEMIKNIEYPEVFDKADATHVVVGVQYGGKAIFDFQKSFDTVEAKLDAEGSLKAQIDKIPKVSIGVEGSGKYQRNETNTDENILCKYSGDFEMDQLPTSLKEAVHIYQELPKKLSENDTKAVPIVAWLLPIAELDSNHQKTCIDIDKPLLDKCIKFNEDMNELKASTNDIRTGDIIQKFPSLLEKLNTFYSKILDPVDTTVKKELRALIPEVRYGRKYAYSIANLIEMIYSSNYSPARLQKWIDVKKQEIAFLENLTSDMTRNTIIEHCASEADHISKRKRIDFCYKIRIEENDKFLENFTDPFQVTAKKEEIRQPFYFQKEKTMIRMANQLKMFADANREPNNSFHIKEDMESKKTEGPSSISVWIDGKQEELDHLPTEPTNLQIRSTDSNQTVLLSWDPPEFGAATVEKVILNYFTPEAENESTVEINHKKNTALIQNLSPQTTYTVKVSQKSRYGMSPSCGTTFTTKPAEAQYLLRIGNIRVNSFHCLLLLGPLIAWICYRSQENIQ